MTYVGSIAYHISEILKLIGEDPERDGLKDTPARVEKMYLEVFKGYKELPASHLKIFKDDTDEMVIVKDINFFSFCEHHIMPFAGKMHIGYLPKGKVIGISKLVRIARVFSARLQIQERLTNQIAQVLDDELDARGVMVWIEAEHMCMTIRGVKSPGAKTITSKATGAFLEKNNNARLEFLEAIK